MERLHTETKKEVQTEEQPTIFDESELKQRVLFLVSEFRDIVSDMPNTLKKPMSERIKVQKRMKEIRKELSEIKEKMPHD